MPPGIASARSIERAPQRKKGGFFLPSLYVRPLALAAALLLAALLAGCGLRSPAPATAKVGLIAPLSGADAASGAAILAATRIAIAEANAANPARPFELVAYDNGGDPRVTERRLSQLGIDPAVVGVLVSDPSSQDAAEGLALVLPGASPNKRQSFPLGPDAVASAREAAAFALSLVGRGMPVAIVAEKTEASEEIAALFSREAGMLGMRVAAEADVQRESANHEAAARLVYAGSPDLIFFTGSPRLAAGFLAAYRDAGGRAPLLLAGDGTLTQDALRLAGDSAGDLYYVAGAPPPADASAAARFRQAFRGATGIEPRPVDLLAYDGLRDLMLAAEKAGPGQDLSREMAKDITRQESRGRLADAAGKASYDRVYIYRAGKDLPGKLVWETP